MSNYSDDLISKTKNAVDEKINEASVLYALVQLNKAAEDLKRESEFPSITFYRNWLVHTDLDRPHEKVKEAFRKWDEILDGIDTGTTSEEATKKIMEVIGLENLFRELSTLGLSVEDSKKGPFVEALVSGLIDAPVRWNGKHVKEYRFTFEKHRKEQTPSYVCHMQIQHQKELWFNGPEIHITSK